MKSKALDNFQKRLESFSKLKNINQTLADKIAERGVELAKENYSGYERVSVDKQETEKPGKMQIIAKGKGLAFVEFGTGNTGEGTYPDKDMLPKDTIEFESPKGTPQKTQGYVYYYPNKKTKVNGGWYANGVFHKGQRAKAQMFYTSQQIRRECGEIVKETIREILNK